MTQELVDDVPRRRIRQDLGAALFVEAGAGTGKTRELVERLLALIQSGVSVRSIAAITFTEAAAAELRDRVRFKLEQLHAAGDQQARRIAATALQHLDGAALETLHSFAGRILGLYPVEAQLPPRFQVLDDIGFAIAADQEWERVAAELLDDPGLELPLTYALALGVRISGARFGNGDLRAVFDALGENWDRLPATPFAAAPFFEPDVGPLVAAIDEAVAFRSQCRDDDDRLVAYLDDLADYRRRLAHATTPVERARVLARDVPEAIRATQGKRERWVDVNAARAAVKAARDLRGELLEQLGQSVLPPLLEALSQAALRFTGRRRAEGMLSFHDLLVLARNLLRDDDRVRAELHGRFQRILIDEFQDTDPLQAEIAGLLARDAGGQLAPGRVFFVGDAKQSIYRFRRADIDLFSASRARFECEAAVLGSNFRSTQAVLDWCNAVFPNLLLDEQGQAPYQALSAARADPSGGSVHMIGGPLPGTRAAQAREIEAEALAHVLGAIHRDAWPVFDAATGGWRPARFDDIAVLIRSRTILPSLQRALEDGDVPYRVESRSLVYNTQEIRDLTNILAAIDDPTDEVAVVASLRSPGFGCGDDDLLRHRQSGGRWDYMAPPPQAPADQSPVVAGFTFLRDLHARRFWLPLGDLAETVIRELQLREIAFAYRRPREHWQRYRFLLEQVRGLEANYGANLRALVLWLRRQAEGAALVNESVVPEEDDDAVRVMTVHAAKGLEFPIVVVAGFGVSATQRSFILWGAEGTHPEVKLGSAATAGFETARADDARLDRHERDRLMYVAATRARDHLVVSVFHPEPRRTEPAPDARRLMEAAAAAPDTWISLVAVGPPPAPAPASPQAQPLDSVPMAIEEWRAARATLLARQLRRTVMAATELAHVRHAENDGEEGDAVFRRGRAGTSVGRAVHAVLQTVDLATGDGLARLAVAQAAAEGVPALAGDVERLARAALGSDPVREALAAGRYWREVFVSAEHEGVLVEGFIDLLYETPAGLVIVDYKTDSVRDDAEIAAAMDGYRLQGATYAFALQRNLGRPVAGCRFLFLRGGEPRVIAVDDLPGAVAEVQARASAAALEPLVHSADSARG